jgi:hypothetical protein
MIPTTSALDEIKQPDIRKMLEGRAHALLSGAFLKRSHAIFHQPRRLAVCHEVGHAVVYVAQGDTVASIEVSQSENLPNFWGGYTNVPGVENVSTRDPPEQIRLFIHRKISGYAGELELAKDRKITVASAVDEIVVSQYFAERAKLDWAALLVECRGTIRKHRDVAQELIAVLKHKDKIEGDELQIPLSRITVETEPG